MVNRGQRKSSLCVAVMLFGAAGCTPEIADNVTTVAGPRLLAARSVPAEARPGETVAMVALDVSPMGATGRSLEWAICTARAPLTSAGTLSAKCLTDSGPDLIPIGTGPSAAAILPRDVCSTFGPSQPPPRVGQPAGRPADPDSTGGFYQPIRIRMPDVAVGRAFASFEIRALCSPGGLTPEQLGVFSQRYRPNANPEIVALALTDGTTLAAIESDPSASATLGAGAPLTLRVSWPACPGQGEDVCGDGICGIDEGPEGCPGDCTSSSAQGCGGSESYLWFDPVARTFVSRRETMTVSWFATAGTFATARTGRSEDEAPSSASAGYSDNIWTPPAAPTDVLLWVVVRDARGGSTWSSHRLLVR